MHVRTRLAPYQYPREIEFIDALPMTTTGAKCRGGSCGSVHVHSESSPGFNPTPIVPISALHILRCRTMCVLCCPQTTLDFIP